MSEAALQQLKAALEQQGFACYETTVGGPGVGILASHSRALDQDKLEASRAQFHAQAELTDEDRSRFAQWIDGQGDWIHS